GHPTIFHEGTRQNNDHPIQAYAHGPPTRETHSRAGRTVGAGYRAGSGSSGLSGAPSLASSFSSRRRDSSPLAGGSPSASRTGSAGRPRRFHSSRQARTRRHALVVIGPRFTLTAKPASRNGSAVECPRRIGPASRVRNTLGSPMSAPSNQ